MHSAKLEAPVLLTLLLEAGIDTVRPFLSWSVFFFFSS